MLLKSRASLTCFRACFLPGRAKDLSAARYIGLYVKYPLFVWDCNETWPFSTNLRKIFKYLIIWLCVQWEPNCWMRADRRTDRHDEANSRFFAILPIFLKTSTKVCHGCTYVTWILASLYDDIKNGINPYPAKVENMVSS